MAIRYVFAILCFLSPISYLSAQPFPDKIRGYKVQKTKVKIEPMAPAQVTAGDNEVLVAIRYLRLSIESLFSASTEVDVEVTANVASGHIDLITFRDIRVNGIEVVMNEFDTPFEMKRKQRFFLPKPLRGSIRISLRELEAYSKLVETKEKWTIAGTVFVFGKFRKYGFKFKRVIPIPIEMQIDNPLAPPTLK